MGGRSQKCADTFELYKGALFAAVALSLYHVITASSHYERVVQ